MATKKTLLISIIFFLLSNTVIAEEPDWTSYQQVLNQVTAGIKNNISLMQVDYQTINVNGSLNQAYQDLSAFKVERLSNRNEKLAFYINAYNILALKKVVDHWPTHSIKDAGSFFSPVWGQPAGSLNGKTVTLDQIEHEILRPMGEPRIHLAIVCASVSCPDLRNEPYRSEKLNEQLDDQTRQFLNNPGKGLRVEKSMIRVSKIFDWFEEDFAASGGVAEFIHRYKTGLPALKIKANIPYDWSINDLQ